MHNLFNLSEAHFLYVKLEEWAKRSLLCFPFPIHRKMDVVMRAHTHFLGLAYGSILCDAIHSSYNSTDYMP